VIAPFDGKVVFSGPFRNYGQILIIEHRGGYHTVLAGLSRIDATVGQWLLAGEPVGVLAARSQGKPTLYVELRHNGQPINPAPWIVARTGKVRG
ncbi:MAG: murein hydrolase activator EnvC family protein, partial [Alphaproteobacteria bacterium]